MLLSFLCVHGKADFRRPGGISPPPWKQSSQEINARTALAQTAWWRQARNYEMCASRRCITPSPAYGGISEAGLGWKGSICLYWLRFLNISVSSCRSCGWGYAAGAGKFFQTTFSCGSASLHCRPFCRNRIFTPFKTMFSAPLCFGGGVSFRDKNCWRAENFPGAARLGAGRRLGNGRDVSGKK